MSNNDYTYSFVLPREEKSFTIEILEGFPPPDSLYKWLSRGLLDMKEINNYQLVPGDDVLEHILFPYFFKSTSSLALMKMDCIPDYDLLENKEFEFHYLYKPSGKEKQSENKIRRTQQNNIEFIKSFILQESVFMEFLDKGLDPLLQVARLKPDTEPSYYAKSHVDSGFYFLHVLMHCGHNSALKKAFSLLSTESKVAFFKESKTKSMVVQMLTDLPDTQALEICIEHGLDLKSDIDLFHHCRTKQQLEFLLRHGLDLDLVSHPGPFLNWNSDEGVATFREMIDLAFEHMSLESFYSGIKGLYCYGRVENLNKKIDCIPSLYEDLNGTSMLPLLYKSLLFNQEAETESAQVFLKKFHVSPIKNPQMLKKFLISMMSDYDPTEKLNSFELFCLRQIITNINGEDKVKVKNFEFKDPDSEIENTERFLIEMLDALPPQKHSHNESSQNYNLFLQPFKFRQMLFDGLVKSIGKLGSSSLLRLYEVEKKTLYAHSTPQERIEFFKNSRIFAEVAYQADYNSDKEFKKILSDELIGVLKEVIINSNSKNLLIFEKLREKGDNGAASKKIKASSLFSERFSDTPLIAIEDFVYNKIENNAIQEELLSISDLKILYVDFNLAKYMGTQFVDEHIVRKSLSPQIYEVHKSRF